MDYSTETFQKNRNVDIIKRFLKKTRAGMKTIPAMKEIECELIGVSRPVIQAVIYQKTLRYVKAAWDIVEAEEKALKDKIAMKQSNLTKEVA